MITAWCEGCDVALDVSADALLASAARCPACGTLLAVAADADEVEHHRGLDGDAGGADDADDAGGLAAADGPVPDFDAPEAPQDGAGEATPGPGAGRAPLDRGPDTRAYLSAARALAGFPGEAAAAPAKSGAGAPAPRKTTRLIPGAEPLEPPLPAWDGGDTQEVKKLARTRPSERLGPPVDLGDELREAMAHMDALPDARPGPTDAEPPAAADPTPTRQPDAPPAPPPAGDAIGELATVHVRDGQTRGRGSRVFDRAEVRRRAEGEPAGPGAPAPRGSTGARRRKDERGGGRLFDEEDLDWASLVEEGLPELDVPDPDARRVVVRMPAAAALQSTSDVFRLDDVFRQLDPAALTAAPVGADGSRHVQLAHALPPRVDADAGGGGGSRGEATLPLGQAPDPDQTLSWSVAEARRGAGGAAPTPRAAPAPPAPTPLRVIERVEGARLDAALVCARAPDGPEAEAYATLAHALLARAPGEPARAVLVAAALPGEGVTTVAANLALVAARWPGGAVLVDADPRGGGVLRAFGVGAVAEGLLDAVRAEEAAGAPRPEAPPVDPRRWLVELHLGSLDVLALGGGAPGAAGATGAERRLAGPAARALLARLRAWRPDAALVVDAGALDRPSGARALVDATDGALLVVRRGRAPRREVARAVEALGRRRVLGVAWNAG